MIAGTPGYVVVRKDFPAKNFAEFQDYVKANPGKVTSGHAGVGSTPHLQCLLLSSLTGMKFADVPYKGSAPAMNDLVAGQIDSMCDLAPTVVPQVQGGNIRALLISLQRPLGRDSGCADLEEAGIPAYLFSGLERDLRAGRHAEAGDRPTVRRRCSRRSPIPACRSVSPMSAPFPRPPRKRRRTSFRKFLSDEIANGRR